jgi:hypothetical protein
MALSRPFVGCGAILLQGAPFGEGRARKGIDREGIFSLTHAVNSLK